MANNELKQYIPTENSSALMILERIKKEDIKPYSRWQFYVSEWGIWILWVATVLVGALALAVMSYVTMSANYALYEATHDNFFTFFVAVLPYLWVILFIVMTYLAVVELRNTKKGYRYSTFQILASSLFFSIVMSAFFHLAGLGYMLDQSLGNQLSMYMSMDKMEQGMWQMPQNGRLVGVVTSDFDDESDTPQLINFSDKNGNKWLLISNELDAREIRLLMSGERVRLLGTTTSARTFHTCGVFPLMFGRPMDRNEMERQRKDFDDVMKAHLRIIGEVGDNSDDMEVPPDKICAHLEMMKKIAR